MADVSTPEAEVYLTFDDGPHPQHTARLLDTLGELGMKATFFLTGGLVGGQEALVERMVEEGHGVANHAWDHVDLVRHGREAWEGQILRTRALLEDVTGHEVSLFRPPYGAVDGNLLAWCHSHGMRVTLWDVEGADWEEVPAEVVHERVTAALQPGGVILLHDGRHAHLQPNAVVRLLSKTLAERGWRTSPLA